MKKNITVLYQREKRHGIPDGRTHSNINIDELGKPSFKKIKKIMENSIIQKNTVYFNTRPLFKAIK